MESEEKNNDLEERKFKLEQDKFKHEKTKFYISIAAVVITLVGLIFGFIRFFNERKREYNSLYRNTLSKVLAGDVETQKIALVEITKFDDKKNEYIPILINLMNDNHKENNRALDKYLVISFISTGKQMPDELVLSNQNAQKTSDQELCDSTGWAICQILKNASGKRGYHYNFSGVLLSNNDLNNLNTSSVLIQNSRINTINFDNSAFQKCDFSHTVFSNSSFWKTKFSEDMNLEGTQFIECNLQEAIFDCDITKTLFKRCNVLDLQLTDKKNMNEDTFRSCQNSSTIKHR